MKDDVKDDKVEDDNTKVKKLSGKRPINSRDRKNVSMRAMKGKLEVIKTKTFSCPKCHGKKFLDTMLMGTKCSKCKTRVKL